jgi:hypothetical protein
VWDGCYERDIEKLEKIQLEAARIVTGLTKFASKDSLYFETGWKTLANRRETRKLIKFIINYALLLLKMLYIIFWNVPYT